MSTTDLVTDTQQAGATPPAVPPTRLARRRRTGRAGGRSSLTWRIVVIGLLTVCALYFLVPVYWLAVAATKDTGDLFGSFGLWFSDFRLLENIRHVLTYDGGIYVRWVLNSVLYAGVGAAIATALASMGGYALAKFEFRGREAVFNTILAGVLIPGTALALPLFLLFSQLGLGNTYLAVLLPSVVSPFGIYLCRIYAAAGVPDSVLEAARIDGASEVRVFRTLVLRLLTPALVTVFLFQFVGIWNNYFLPLVMLSDPQLYPVTLGLTSWHSFADRLPELYQLTVGGAFLSVVPLMIAIVVLQKYWRGGLAEGSVKG
ncbi:carbohydrate ABC transporter permease [Cellulomonas sp. Marseille-Q8402]